MLGVVSDQICNLACDRVGIGGRQVDLVDDRNDVQVVLDREIGVRECLRLRPLRRVDDEQRALAGLQGPRYLVGEVHMAGRVDEVELVALPLDADRLRLDRDAALALEIHRVEHLLAHVTTGDGVRELEDAIGQRRFPMVDMGDDREVADAVLSHVRRALKRLSNASNAPSSRTLSARHASEVDGGADERARPEPRRVGPTNERPSA